ncbi:MAG TPA: hypothetical protein VHY59_09145, partial [Chthoniobacterales bacterium]|nr:hypothetical protein [Chthoniobacterales bacterium]
RGSLAFCPGDNWSAGQDAVATEPFDLVPSASPGLWSVTLRSWTSRLDAMEREFAPCDTARFGSLPSRVRYIDNVRAKYPDCFTAPAIPEG